MKCAFTFKFLDLSFPRVGTGGGREGGADNSPPAQLAQTCSPTADSVVNKRTSLGFIYLTACLAQ